MNDEKIMIENICEGIMRFIKQRLSYIDIDPNYEIYSQYYLCKILQMRFNYLDIYYVPRLNTFVVGYLNNYFNYLGKVIFDNNEEIVEENTYINSLNTEDKKVFLEKYIF